MTYSRTRVFSFHLGISLLIFLTVLYFLYFVWFPEPYFSLDGGSDGLMLLFLVDVVLGPTLTLLFYRPNKPRAWIDLSVIAVIQISALIAGLTTVQAQRPIALTYHEHRFLPLDADTLAEPIAKLKDSGVEPKISLKVMQQRLDYYISQPTTNLGEDVMLIKDELNGFPGRSLRLDRYMRFADLNDHPFQRGLSLKAITKVIPKAEQHWENQFTAGAITNYQLLKARYGMALLAFDADFTLVNWLPLTQAHYDSLLESLQKGQANASASQQPLRAPLLN